MRYPGVTQAGSTSNEPVVLLDFYPTFAEVAGAELPKDQVQDGVSLLPVMRQPDRPLGREAIYWHFPAYLQAYEGGKDETRDPLFRARPCSVIRSGDWKLIEYFEKNEVELFNLKDDPGEQKNLANDQADKTMALLAKLKDWQESVDAPIPTQKNPKYQAE